MQIRLRCIHSFRDQLWNRMYFSGVLTEYSMMYEWDRILKFHNLPSTKLIVTYGAGTVILSSKQVKQIMRLLNEREIPQCCSRHEKARF